MEKQLLTEEEVKKILNIQDFRTISKDKIIQFTSLIPKLDKELAIKIINQFPNYVTMVTNIVTSLINMCNEAIKSNKETEKEAINAYKAILETITKELEDGEVTPEEREKYNNQMIEVADKINEIDIRKKMA